MVRRIAILIVVAGCSGPSKAPEPAPPHESVASATPIPAPIAANGVRVTLAEVGLEATSLDRSVDPCVDFYQFACGGWMQTNQIPADRARWARFSEIDEKNKSAIKGLLEDDAKGAGTDPTAKKLGDYYSSCMDEAAIESVGTAKIKPLLDRAQKVKDAKSWLAAVIALHEAGIPVVFGVSTGADLKNSLLDVVQLDTAGLGLPDRDYYIKPEFADKVAAYRTHVAKMLALLGTPQPKAEAAAADIVALETELAKLTKTGVEKRDVQAGYNPIELDALAKQTKSIDWKAYFTALGVIDAVTNRKLDGAKIVVGTPKFFAGLDALRAKIAPAQWSSYFTYHVLEATAFGLPKAFDDEAFALQQTLTGVEKQKDRYKRCADATQDALGELLGQQYVARYFPGTAKQTATKLVDAIVKSMGDELASLDWMSAATKQIAVAKLAKVVRKVGFPDAWRIYDFDVKRDDFAGNELRASAFETHRVLAKAGKPVDRAEWGMNAYTVNAYYDPTENNTALPAGILQPPFFGADRGVAANLGGIGMVIGHELTHGFDDQGAQFDSDGNLVKWWGDADKTKFDAKGTCVADQYSTFEAMPKGFVQGRLTLGENIADLGGVKMAFNAYRTLRKDAAKVYVADGFTEDQQFFLAVGQAWCDKDRPAEIQRRLTVDVHSPPKFRVYGALRNLPEFSQAFSCAAGTPMHPASGCSVW